MSSTPRVRCTTPIRLSSDDIEELMPVVSNGIPYKGGRQPQQRRPQSAKNGMNRFGVAAVSRQPLFNVQSTTSTSTTGAGAGYSSYLQARPTGEVKPIESFDPEPAVSAAATGKGRNTIEHEYERKLEEVLLRAAQRSEREAALYTNNHNNSSSHNHISGGRRRPQSAVVRPSSAGTTTTTHRTAAGTGASSSKEKDWGNMDEELGIFVDTQKTPRQTATATTGRQQQQQHKVGGQRMFSSGKSTSIAQEKQQQQQHTQNSVTSPPLSSMMEGKEEEEEVKNGMSTEGDSRGGPRSVAEEKVESKRREDNKYQQEEEGGGHPLGTTVGENTATANGEGTAPATGTMRIPNPPRRPTTAPAVRRPLSAHITTVKDHRHQHQESKDRHSDTGRKGGGDTSEGSSSSGLHNYTKVDWLEYHNPEPYRTHTPPCPVEENVEIDNDGNEGYDNYANGHHGNKNVHYAAHDPTAFFQVRVGGTGGSAAATGRGRLHNDTGNDENAGVGTTSGRPQFGHSRSYLAAAAGCGGGSRGTNESYYRKNRMDEEEKTTNRRRPMSARGPSSVMFADEMVYAAPHSGGGSSTTMPKSTAAVNDNNNKYGQETDEGPMSWATQQSSSRQEPQRPASADAANRSHGLASNASCSSHSVKQDLLKTTLGTASVTRAHHTTADDGPQVPSFFANFEYTSIRDFLHAKKKEVFGAYARNVSEMTQKVKQDAAATARDPPRLLTPREYRIKEKSEESELYLAYQRYRQIREKETAKEKERVGEDDRIASPPLSPPLGKRDGKKSRAARNLKKEKLRVKRKV